MAKILCFGDSITRGTSDPLGGWPQRVANYLRGIYVHENGGPMHSIYNLGVSLDTSTDLVKRMENELRARGSSNCIVLILIGTNDSSYSENGETAVDEKLYQDNLRRCIDVAKKRIGKTMLIGLPACDESKLQPVPWRTDTSYSNKNIARYNDLARKVAKESEVAFEDLFKDFKELDAEIYLRDGIHPTEAGYQYIADRIKKKVAEMANDYK